VYNMGSEKCLEPIIANRRFFVATISYCPGHSSGRKVNAISGQPPLVLGSKPPYARSYAFFIPGQVTMDIKQCKLCHVIKPLSDFYKNPHCRDGYAHKCKECAKAYAASRTPDPESHKSANQKWRSSEKGKKSAVKRKREYSERNPLKIKARAAIAVEIHAGRMPSARTLTCSVCPVQADGYHHYNGYEERHWLDVIPLCRACHDGVEV
jgi:hypothetical protein